MITLVPRYYNEFQCVADKCKHSCCIGWEIDIDSESYSKYISHDGKLKDKFEKCICHDDVPHFILDENERCPFLNNMNLCDIHIEIGEKSLCQICTDHPRFRNFYSGITEIGLGLCCEEACRIILGYNDCLTFDVIDGSCDGISMTNEEYEFFEIRNKIISTLCDTTKCIDGRFEAVWNILGISVKSLHLCELFADLEYMEHDVSCLISDTCNGIEKCLTQLGIYFIFRHLAGSLDDGLLAERAVLSYVSLKAVSSMCKSDTFEELCENARIYSSEIEYSEDNIDELLYRVGDLIEIYV